MAAQSAGTDDVIELEDGRRLTGEIVGEDDRFVSLRSGGVLRAYPRSSVRSITRAERPPAPLPPPTEDPLTDRDAEKAAKKAAKKKAEKAKAGKTRDSQPAELSADARTWLLGLLDRARSTEATDPAVRSSLAAAIHALGPAAETDVRAAADAAEGDAGAFLTKLADKIQAKAAKRTEGARTKRKKAAAGAPTDDPMAGGGKTAKGKTTDVRPKSPRDKLLGLGMTPEQGREMRETLKEFAVARRDLYQAVRDGSVAREDARTELADLRKATMETVAGVLDATQYAEFESFAAELFDGRSARRPGKKKAKNNDGGKAGEKQRRKDAGAKEKPDDASE
jgi:hypothetical protein